MRPAHRLLLLGLTIGLVQSWEDIVGPLLAPVSRPERIRWPRRRHEDDPFQPALLVIACSGAAALQIQHQTGEIIGRVNAFLGFPAVGGIRIVQKPIVEALWHVIHEESCRQQALVRDPAEAPSHSTPESR